MTNRIERLQQIRAKCVELLAFTCPGPAEAGWRSTIAAIDGLLAAESLIYAVQNDYDDSPPRWWIEQRTKVLEAQNAIFTAWEDDTTTA